MSRIDKLTDKDIEEAVNMVRVVIGYVQLGHTRHAVELSRRIIKLLGAKDGHKTDKRTQPEA